VAANIVAACWRCNQARHRRKFALESDEFQDLVLKRIRLGRWHERSVHAAGLLSQTSSHLVGRGLNEGSA
jgi:hypothetical protein